ncbi:hypothetical protein [Croceicoccus naphthovorans]|uniref:hypothetical protein n=1 Tax=Croceicoccus naphthovorans TaxID=1348774 RepID=UPI000AFB51A8|nr:hypothetical protein [Croceicoccus naphthovorans]MBB3991520.1 hypothetical protein [Croceicoccus naphthovorans]
MTQAEATQDEGAVLAQMQTLARQLAQSDDALMGGQYEYLLARIEALIEIRGGIAS